MSNVYLTKAAGLNLRSIGSSIKNTAGILAGKNVAPAKALYNKSNRLYEKSKTRLNEYAFRSLIAHHPDRIEILKNLTSSAIKRTENLKVTRGKHLKELSKQKALTNDYRKTAIVGSLGVGTAAYTAGNMIHEKKAGMENKYLEKIAGMTLGPLGKRVAAGAAVGGVTGAVVAGKDNRIKGALAGATAGGVAGSVFGRMPRPMPKNVFPAGKGPGLNAKLINPKPIKGR